MTNREKYLWRATMLLLICASLWGFGIIPAIIPQAAPAANKRGTGTVFQIADATSATSGNCASYDANANLKDFGAPCNGTAGAVNWPNVNTGTGTNTTLAGLLGTGASLGTSGTGLNETNEVRLYTVATLPAAAGTGKFAYVTDGASATDCTVGSGSTKVLCIANGAAWVTAGVATAPSTIILTGVIGSLPAAGTAGRLYVATDSFYDQIRDSGAVWQYFIGGQLLSFAPSTAIGSFTAVNTGSNTITNLSNGGIIWSSPGSASTLFRGALEPKSGTFTIKVAFGVLQDNANNSGVSGIMLTDGTNASTSQVIIMGLRQAGNVPNLYISKWTLGGAFTGDYVNSSLSPPTPARWVWMKMVQDSSNRTYSFSWDNVTYVQVLQTTNTDYLTTADIGYVIFDVGNSRPAVATYVYWAES